ncbi:MAG TPA: hypothetical protein PK349_09185 [Candidatus Hydrogenedentes bacterium]|nr:hypothetical protein [Candidatus Hydrogenedentota bacterium]
MMTIRAVGLDPAGKHEIGIRKAVHLVGPQDNLDPPPSESDIRVMIHGLCLGTNPVHQFQGLGEITGTVPPL